MLTWLFFALAAIALLLALWPFGFYQASLWLASRLHKFPGLPAKDASARDATFAVCMCAYNEAGVIRAKIENLLTLRAANGGELDILVYVDGASDDTANILEEYAERITLVVSSERLGKTHGMNLLVGQTDASIILFTDANVMLESDATAILRRYFADQDIGCVCASLIYVNANESATASVGSTYWGLNEWSKSLETATGSVMGADGALFAIRRSLHRQVPDGLIDDIYVSFDILFQGMRVVRAPELRVFEQHTTQAKDEFRRKIRIACECMHVHRRTFSTWRRQSFWNIYKYVGHRLLRWLGGYLLLVSAFFTFLALSSVMGLGTTFFLFLAFVAMFALAVRLSWGPAMKIWNAGLAFAGTSIGVWQALRGKRAITWNVAASARSTSLTAPAQPG